MKLRDATLSMQNDGVANPAKAEDELIKATS